MKMNRRSFLAQTVAASAGATLVLPARAQTTPTSARSDGTPAPAAAALPTGRIGKLQISRLISGGNLISGWAHSRDLFYVPSLMRHYNTDEKVLDTLEILEQNGVNTIIADPSERPLRLLPKYWKERGGRIQWIAEGHPTSKDLKTNMAASIDTGAKAVYVQGVIGDRWLRGGEPDLLGECVSFIKSQGLPGGIGAHLLDVVAKAEERRYGADFYVKTFHHTRYWSARRPDQNQDVVDNSADNYWEMTPEKTIEFMKDVEKPWIAFKVLAAGAIRPESGFRYAFENGADFVCVGMFDFQVAEDAALARKVLAASSQRERPWMG